MWFHVLACDYDRTLATAGRIAPETMQALQRVRDSGRRVVLITGREFEDLLRVCPELDFFDWVVAENGAVLFDPRAKRVEDLAAAPPADFLSSLRDAGVPFSSGRVVVSTVVPYETAVLHAIQRLGLELQIIFNREAVMVLPSGISKESGLEEALRRLGVSPHNVVAVGDGENDHAFLAQAGFAAAVANAVPALAAAADAVTRAPNGAGVRELVEEALLVDMEPFRARLLRRAIAVGTATDGTPVGIPVRGPNVLITGASGTGTSTLAGVFVERLVRGRYIVCLLDPEGDYRTLAEQEGIVRLASAAGSEETRAEEVEGLLRHRSTSVAIDLSSLDHAEKVRATARFLQAVQRLRTETGAPHWVVIDEAHRVFPPEGSVAEAAFAFDWTGICLVTNEPDRVAPGVLAVAREVLATSASAIAERLPLVAADRIPGGELALGEALELTLAASGPPAVRRFRVAAREMPHERPVKKRATAAVPPERAFHFRGPADRVDLVAENLETFAMLVRGVDDETWLHHLRSGDVVAWLRDAIADPALAAEVAAIATNGDAASTRRAVLEAIGRREAPLPPPGSSRMH